MPNNLFATERVNPRTADIDKQDSAGILSLMNAEDAAVAPAVGKAIAHIAPVVDACVQALADLGLNAPDNAPAQQQAGRIIYVGAGTSGRLGVLDAAECPPTFGTPPDRVLALIAGGEPALRHAIEGAEDDVEAGQREAAALNLGPNDVMIGLSASGSARYVLGAIEAAQNAGATTACVTCNPTGALAQAVALPIVVEPGPEVVAGSTRLKAGTAQKLVLNMITTATMIRLGKTVGNLMVDVQPTNQKLRDRAVRIVGELTGLPADEALAALETHDWRIKAVVASLR